MFYFDKKYNINFENEKKALPPSYGFVGETLNAMKSDYGSDRTKLAGKYSLNSFLLLFIFIGIAILISFIVGSATKNICLGFLTFLPFFFILFLIWYFFLSKI